MPDIGWNMALKRVWTKFNMERVKNSPPIKGLPQRTRHPSPCQKHRRTGTTGLRPRRVLQPSEWVHRCRRSIRLNTPHCPNICPMLWPIPPVIALFRFEKAFTNPWSNPRNGAMKPCMMELPLEKFTVLVLAVACTMASLVSAECPVTGAWPAGMPNSANLW